MVDAKVIPLRSNPPSSPPPTEPLPLSGRRIMGVSYNPIKDKNGKKSTRPIFWLDDGTCLHFFPEENGVRLERIRK
jgi:hypothetical protein